MRARKSLRTRALNCCGGSPPGSAAAGEVLAFHRSDMPLIGDGRGSIGLQMFPAFFRSGGFLGGRLPRRSHRPLLPRPLLATPPLPSVLRFHRARLQPLPGPLPRGFRARRPREVRSGSLRQPPPLHRRKQIRAAAPRAPLLRFALRPRARRWSPLRPRSIRRRRCSSSACFGGVEESGLLVLLLRVPLPAPRALFLTLCTFGCSSCSSCSAGSSTFLGMRLHDRSSRFHTNAAARSRAFPVDGSAVSAGDSERFHFESVSPGNGSTAVRRSCGNRNADSKAGACGGSCGTAAGSANSFGATGRAVLPRLAAPWRGAGGLSRYFASDSPGKMMGT